MKMLFLLGFSHITRPGDVDPITLRTMTPTLTANVTVAASTGSTTPPSCLDGVLELKYVPDGAAGWVRFNDAGFPNLYTDTRYGVVYGFSVMKLTNTDDGTGGLWVEYPAGPRGFLPLSKVIPADSRYHALEIYLPPPDSTGRCSPSVRLDGRPVPGYPNTSFSTTQSLPAQRRAPSLFIGWSSPDRVSQTYRYRDAYCSLVEADGLVSYYNSWGLRQISTVAEVTEPEKWVVSDAIVGMSFNDYINSNGDFYAGRASRKNVFATPDSSTQRAKFKPTIEGRREDILAVQMGLRVKTGDTMPVTATTTAQGPFSPGGTYRITAEDGLFEIPLSVVALPVGPKSLRKSDMESRTFEVEFS